MIFPLRVGTDIRGYRDPGDGPAPGAGAAAERSERIRMIIKGVISAASNAEKAALIATYVHRSNAAR
jgi:hypothetical protein